ncbi:MULTISPECIES: flagellar export protein FliJ [Modicisalibacter]|uniref:flagellar export protein FliJ n=1 Tax=Modicisalibacter TaxID=574347 RepID=UPI00100BE119|nr:MULTISPECIES: flagellar export protein FliJ [Halomonadaceae]MBZ9556980.1 flagellar export protein FliJ [Modicisalibacter sp. R2A 31.J]MBZ9574306.1 flagellar export protein FliJ [Modicisalibacter sp. MOD 31.J]
MTHASPLDTLISLTRDARDSANVKLVELRRARQEAQVQLETLQQYRQEYREKLQRAMENGIGPDSWRNYQQFLLSLDGAIDRARKTLQDRESKLGQGQQHWQQEQRKLSAYDTLADRREQREQQRINRREQRQSDEMASNQLLRRQTQESRHETSH